MKPNVRPNGGVFVLLAVLLAGMMPMSVSEWPRAMAQELYLEPSARLLIVTTERMLAAAEAYAQAREKAWGESIDQRPPHRRHPRLVADVLTVKQCMAEFPNLSPAHAIRAVAHQRLIIHDTLPAKWDDMVLPGDDRYAPKSHLLLVGDVPEEGATVDPDRHVPCFYRRSNVIPAGVAGTQEQWENVPSDNPYASRDIDDDVPIFPVGRLPFTEPAQLTAHLAAVTAYEENPPPGKWRNRVTIFAGDPGFEQLGPVVRRLIERAYEMGVIQNLSDASAATFTYANEASPYTWPAPEFSDKIVDEINDGALVLNYLGHGWKDSVDTLKFNGETYRVFTARDAARVNCAGKRPVAAFFTCYTGAFDYRTPSLAEALILNPNGPIGVIASSRISNELNYLLETAFLHEMTKERTPTLGRMFLCTKRRMLLGRLPLPPALAQQFGLPTHAGYSDGKRTHLWLYNLFGDPTVRLAHPRDTSSYIHVPEAVRAGDEFEVELMAEIPNAATVTTRLECLRTNFVLAPRPVDYTGVPAVVFDAIRQNHARANHRLIDRRTVGAETTTVKMRMPAGYPPGHYLVRQYVTDANGHILATGGVRVTVAPSADDDAPGSDF